MKWVYGLTVISFLTSVYSAASQPELPEKGKTSHISAPDGGQWNCAWAKGNWSCGWVDPPEKHTQPCNLSRQTGEAALLPWDVASRHTGYVFQWTNKSHSLEKLLQGVSEQGIVSVVVFSKGASSVLKNFLYFSQNLAHVRSYLVAVLDEESLEYCHSLHLACFNFQALWEAALGQAAPNAPSLGDYNTPLYLRLVWAKPLIIRTILAAGYDVHLSDLDTVYFKDPLASFSRLAALYSADVVAMKERDAFNAGNYLLRSNARTLAFMDQWLGLAPRALHGGYRTQLVLSHILGIAYGLCTDRAACEVLRSQGLAAVFTHVQQGGGGDPCPTPVLKQEESDLCADHRLYLHMMCLPTWKDKVAWFRYLGLWVVDDGGDVLYSAPLHNSLPCAQRLAWLEDAVPPPNTTSQTSPGAARPMSAPPFVEAHESSSKSSN